MELKNNQIEKSLQLLKVVKNYGIAYLWGEVRSGKTGTALNVKKITSIAEVKKYYNLSKEVEVKINELWK